MTRKSTVRVESIVYKGRTFRRYPESIDATCRNYYRATQLKGETTGRKLHIEIWKDTYGELPKGHEIHHKDGDPLNNHIDNLEALTRKEHGKKTRALFTPERLEKFQQNGRMVWEKAPLRDGVCEHCQKPFTTKMPFTRFCSTNCNRNARRLSKVDNETRNCVFCGKEFSVRKSLKIRFCSRSCGQRSQQPRKRDALNRFTK